MAMFTYTAVDTRGQKCSGSIAAANRSAALSEVASKGLTPVSVREQDAKAPVVTAARAPHGRVKQNAVEDFIRELANLLAAGVPLSRALSILAREASHPAAKKQWAAVHDDVVGGMPLAEALGRFPQSFSAVQVAMIRAGETGGFLETVLNQIADFRSRERDLKGKVKGALVYPAVLATMGVGVMIFMLTFFIPRFTEIFSDLGGTLPVLTRGVIAVSNAVRDYGLAIAVAVVLGVVFVVRASKTESGRRAFERALLGIPGVGVLVARLALVRFCRMLGTLLGSGVPLVTALRVAREALGNQMLADAVADSIEQVQQGTSLARSLGDCRQLFPPSAVEMISVAEESGRLDGELNRLAGAYENELDRRLRMLISLAEPLMLLVMAVMVGIVVIGMLLPMFTLQDYIH